MTEKQLLDKIRALSFAQDECVLYLDGHPDCAVALTYFYENREALTAATEEYEAAYGPLTVRGVQGDGWSWISAPWPWQRPSDLGADFDTRCQKDMRG